MATSKRQMSRSCSTFAWVSHGTNSFHDNMDSLFIINHQFQFPHFRLHAICWAVPSRFSGGHSLIRCCSIVFDFSISQTTHQPFPFLQAHTPTNSQDVTWSLQSCRTPHLPSFPYPSPQPVRRVRLQPFDNLQRGRQTAPNPRR